VARHIRRCGRCRERIERLNGENSRLTLLLQPEQEAPDLSQSIMDQITSAREGTAHPERSRSRMSAAWILVAAAFILVALFLFSPFQSRNPGSFKGEREVLVQTATVDGRTVQTHVFESGDADITFIWLEKI
jgi:hypothetical protein